MEIINKTPHEVTIMKKGKPEITFQPNERPARVTQEFYFDDEILGVPIGHAEYGEVVDMPSPKPRTYFIVSRMVATALPDRQDLLVPSGLVRGDEGRVIGCGVLERPNW